MAGPFVSKDAYVKKGTTEVAYATGVTIGIDIDLIKEFAIGDADPKVLEIGAKNYPVSIDQMNIDTAFASEVLGGSTVSLEIAPGGTTTGNPKFTVGSVLFTSWELSLEPNGVVAESVSGEGTELTLGSYP